jgi:hypothetical protein
MSAFGTQIERFISIFESELRYMASDGYQWGNVETGGALYGLRSYTLRPVTMLGTPAGPEAGRVGWVAARMKTPQVSSSLGTHRCDSTGRQRLTRSAPHGPMVQETATKKGSAS